MPPAVKKQILVACLMALTVGNMMINNVVAFLPTYIAAKNWNNSDGFILDSNDNSLIIAMFSVA